MGGDPELHHPGQWHLNVQVEMWKPNLYSFIQKKIFIEDLPDVVLGSGDIENTQHSLLMWSLHLVGKTDKQSQKVKEIVC